MKKFFSRMKGAYRNLSLRTKLLLIILMAVGIPFFAVSALFLRRLPEMIKAQTILEEQEATERSAPVLTNQLQSISNVSQNLRNNTFFTSLLQVRDEESLLSLLSGEAADSFYHVCENVTEKNEITAIRYYIDFPEQEGFTQDSPLFRPLSVVAGTYWHGIFASSHPASLFCPRMYLGIKEQQSLGDLAHITPVRMRDADGNPIEAYQVLYFSSDSIRDTILSHLTREESVAYLTNERNAMITATDPVRAGVYYMDYSEIRKSLMSSNGFLEKQVLGETIYVSYFFLDVADWMLVTVTPSAPLEARTRSLGLTFVLLWVISAMLGILIANALALSLSRRIGRISGQMSLVKNAPPEPLGEPAGTDEIDRLVDSYNFMTETIHSLMKEQERSAEELRLAEFSALQAQINPHFLYNTMEMINWMAQQGKLHETNEAITDLSRFYKLTLSRSGSLSTLEEEIEHITIYTRLQNMRFDDGITLVVDIPDNLLECRIPRLTLQPIIENAILHGILEKDGKTGTIVLTGWEEDEDLVLLISDDGVGIPEEILSTILTGSTSKSSGTHIAIVNTHRRLQILYGNTYGLSYESTVGEGTEVTVRIPMLTDTEDPLLPGSERTSRLPMLFGREDPVIIPGSDLPSPTAAEIRLGRITKDRYNLSDLHALYKVLPENEHFYMFSHFVNTDYPEHGHDYYEMNYLISGHAEEIIDGTEIPLPVGDLVVMDLAARHEIRTPSECLILNICFDEEFLSGILPEDSEKGRALREFLSGHKKTGSHYLYYPLSHMSGASALLTSLVSQYADEELHSSAETERLAAAFFAAL